jgi:2-polyprenyl-3-methyl-5-hydroxy-6-metoxy-1,4-benzoquinol methylase
MPRYEKVEMVEAGILSAWLAGQRLRAAKPYLTGTVLDFACGHGQLTQVCDKERYLGYDVDPRKLEVARGHFPGYQFQTDLPDEQFDTVAALAFIEHVDPGVYLKQFADLLKPGGQIVLTTPHPSYEWIHTAGAKVHIFSPEAHEDHEDLLNADTLAEVASPLSLRLKVSKRFMFGANQLFVLTRD